MFYKENKPLLPSIVFVQNLRCIHLLLLFKIEQDKVSRDVLVRKTFFGNPCEPF